MNPKKSRNQIRWFCGVIVVGCVLYLFLPLSKFSQQPRIPSSREVDLLNKYIGTGALAIYKKTPNEWVKSELLRSSMDTHLEDAMPLDAFGTNNLEHTEMLVCMRMGFSDDGFSFGWRAWPILNEDVFFKDVFSGKCKPSTLSIELSKIRIWCKNRKQ